jgi:diguanylate cyclase (GGDEF)-like protein/PAS domain S-box-containing protein
MPGARRNPPQKPAAFKFPHSDALLQNVLESGSVGTLLVDPDGRVSYASRAVSGILGYEPEALVGLPVQTLIHADSLADAEESMRELFSGKEPACRAERCFVRADGEAVWVLVSASVLRNERTGRPLYLIAQLVDIDRQKRAEAALAESESRMNYALEAARQGVWDHRVGTDTVYYSRMWKLMRGFGADEEVESSQAAWLSRLHPDDRERVREQIKSQDLGVEGYDILEYRERHREGHYVWILSRGKPVEWDDKGNPVRTVGTDTDITRQKMAEAQLAEEKERLRVTLASIGDGVISTDAEGRVTFMNTVAEVMTGWESWEAIGQRVEDVFDVVDSENGEIALNPVTECLARAEPFRLSQDVVLVARTGERREVRDSAAPLRTPEGNIIGAVLVFQDVTESRALQKQLAHSAMHDSLTGLPNRLAFERALSVAADQARRELREHALCFVDLDRFKTVNDSAGHAAGDTLLKEIAAVIRKACRQQDFTARIGGDEFAVMLADCSVNAARRIAQQIVEAIGGVRFAWHGTVYRIGASVGITAITNRSPELNQILSEADAACYVAKASGKNQVAIYDAGQGGHGRFKQIA